MRFCIDCGSSDVSDHVPEGDNRLRRVCRSCGFIFYENPKTIAGCILEWQGKVLLCERAIEPRYGKWTMPAGFMEQGETIAEAAAREAYEEARARSPLLLLHAVFSLPHISQVYAIFRGELSEGDYAAGEESLSVDLFSETEVPWDELAFPVMAESLRLYFEAVDRDARHVHVGDIVRLEDRSLKIDYY